MMGRHATSCYTSCMSPFSDSKITVLGSSGSSLLRLPLLLLSVLFLAAGIGIIAAPELLAYFVASILLLIGVSLFGTWWRLR